MRSREGATEQVWLNPVNRLGQYRGGRGNSVHTKYLTRIRTACGAWDVESSIFAVVGELHDIFPICEIIMADFETVTIVMVDFKLTLVLHLYSGMS